MEKDGVSANTEFTCLVWSDIVKSAMVPSFWNIFVRAPWYYAVFLTSGAISRIRQIAVGPSVVALYPPCFTLIQLVLGIGLAALAYGVSTYFLSTIFGVALAGAAFLGWLHLMRLLDQRIFVHYLMLDYAYFGEWRGQIPPSLSQRVDAFVERVEEALDSDATEVLLVGHSSGAHLVVALASRLLQKRPVERGRLGLLTLGQSIPMISFLPEATATRQDLQRVSEAAGIAWLDVSAPSDGACFPLADPVAISGVSRPQQRHPKVVSAAFSRTLSDDQKAKLKYKFFKKHFQYLCAFECPDQYDYFQLTAGPVPFSDQVHAMKESPTKIVQSFSGYTDV